MSEPAGHPDSEHHAATAVAEPAPPPFDHHDVSYFKVDDAQAAGAIGKMLVAFFFYSLLAMSLVTWWAFAVSRDAAKQADKPLAGEHHDADEDY